MPSLITITGPSQAGKSTAIELFMKCKDENFVPTTVPKFTTRASRSDDKPTEVITVNSLSSKLDLVYQQYDSRYGVSSTSILEKMKEGFSPIIVLNDVRLIVEVKNIFGSLVKSIFLFRKSPKAEELFANAAARGEEISETTKKRFKKAEAIYRIYIENIYLFDHVIINAGDLCTLELQVHGIVDSLKVNKGRFLQ
jgi:guanylate kinase